MSISPAVEPATHACPVCGSREYRAARTRGPLTFGRCRECGLAYVQPLIEDRDPTVDGSQSIRTNEAYNRQMLEEYEVRERAARPLVLERLAYYERALGRPPRSLLEVGSGEGPYYRSYRERGIEWAGIDINPQVAAFAQQHGVPVTYGDFTKLPVERQYDVIVSSQVVEHLLNPRDYLAKVRETLAPGGLLHIDVPNDNALFARLRRLLPSTDRYGFLEPPYHLLAYTRPVLRRLLESAGYEPILCGAYDVCHPVFGQMRLAMKAPYRWAFRASGAVGLGNFLVAVCRVRRP